MKKRDPETPHGIPIWCHHHGSKIKVLAFDKVSRILLIGGSAAKVTIKRAPSVRLYKGDGWLVDWKVVQRQPLEVVRGCRWFDDNELSAAFGLTDAISSYSEWLINRFGGNSAEQGKYIRWGIFLNIPCPGTGHDGDPNVSIHLDDQIKYIVQQLLQQ